jgi:hypothetical protein
MIRKACIALSLISGLASMAHDMPKVEMPKEFDALKGLVGTWEGTSQHKAGAPEEKVTTVYELTSGGTAVVEKLMPGTPHEMVSVYHKEGKTLAMTHYCALGNQPHMVLKKATTETMSFEMTRTAGVSSMKEPHMHAVTLTMSDADTLKQEWTHFEKGKKSGTAVFTLTRKKS